MTEELTQSEIEEMKEKVKKIESSIVSKINQFNENMKDLDKKNEIFKKNETHGFLISQKLLNAIKSKKDVLKIEIELSESINKIDFMRADAMDAQKVSLTSLQELYKEHVEYLTQVINGLNIRCKNLETSKTPKLAKIDEFETSA